MVLSLCLLAGDDSYWLSQHVLWLGMFPILALTFCRGDDSGLGGLFVLLGGAPLQLLRLPGQSGHLEQQGGWVMVGLGQPRTVNNTKSIVHTVEIFSL